MKKRWIAFIIIAAVVAACLLTYVLLSPEDKVLDAAERDRLGGSFIELSDGFTHYSLSGPADGKTVVLIHGGTIPMWCWDSQAAELSRAGYRVLTYDKFGRGYSDRPRARYDQDFYRKQLIELTDSLGLTEPYDIVGLSVGGGTAVNFTAHHPSRVGKLVLIAPLVKDFEVMGISKVPVLGEIVMRLIGIKVIVHRFNTLYKGIPDAETYKRLYFEQTRYKGFQRSLLSMLRNDAVKDYTASYREIARQHREVLLVRGSGDTEITEEMIETIESLVPDILYVPVDGAGHGIVAQKPDVINSLILDFLQ